MSNTNRQFGLMENSESTSDAYLLNSPASGISRAKKQSVVALGLAGMELIFYIAAHTVLSDLLPKQC